MDIGAAVSRQKGTDVAKLRELHRWRESHIFSAVERDVLELTEHMARERVDVPNELFERLRAALGETAVVELASGIAWENYRSRFNRVFDVQAEGYDEGKVCVVPERPHTVNV